MSWSAFSLTTISYDDVNGINVANRIATGSAAQQTLTAQSNNK